MGNRTWCVALIDSLRVKNLISAIMNVVHSDCSGGIAQDACIGVAPGEGMKAEEMASHGIGHGQSAVQTPDKVPHYACVNVIVACISGIVKVRQFSALELGVCNGY